MMILGLVLLVLGWLTGIGILIILGILLLVVGLILLAVGSFGPGIGPRRHYWLTEGGQKRRGPLATGFSPLRQGLTCLQTRRRFFSLPSPSVGRCLVALPVTSLGPALHYRVDD